MKNKATIFVVGATGLVGQTFAKVLTEKKIDANYILFNRAGGAEVEICGKKYITRALTVENVRTEFSKHTPSRLRVPPLSKKGEHNNVFALFSAGGDVSREFAPLFAQLGAVVIDNSSAWRRDANVPLVIPECNIETVKHIKNSAKGTIIANPNCTTIGSLPALKPLDDVFGLRRVIYSTYQAISGAGGRALADWSTKSPYPIVDNVIPYIDGEEEKMVFETNKILGRIQTPILKGKSPISVTATCVRVPVSNCHTVSIVAEFEKPVDEKNVSELLSNASGIVLLRDKLPMPIYADGHDEIFVGRIRVSGNTVCMVTASDNIRKGAASNAVQIMEYLLVRNN
jgi:aspartate-semialdehyde dehydrogenase